jgi:LacI family transcriptional regulator
MADNMITMNGVAKSLGMDKSTVSLALRNDPRISAETKERVISMAKALNYTPNSLARSLSTGQRKTLGVMFPEMLGSFFGPMLDAMYEVASAKGYVLSSYFCSWDSRREEAGIRQFCENRFDGVLWAPSGEGKDIKNAASIVESMGLSMVLLGIFSEKHHFSRYNQVGIDEEDSIKLAFDYLHNLGHREIAIATSSADRFHEALRLRVDRMLKYSALLGISIPEHNILRTVVPVHGGVLIASEIMKRPPRLRPTAVLAVDDNLAKSLSVGFLSLGVKIPEDISILGYDNAEDDSKYPVPITAVSLETAKTGMEATTLLLDLIEKKRPSEKPIIQRIKPEIIIRNSCSSPRTVRLHAREDIPVQKRYATGRAIPSPSLIHSKIKK